MALFEFCLLLERSCSPHDLTLIWENYNMKFDDTKEQTVNWTKDL